MKQMSNRLGSATDHLIQGGWGMTRTTQGGALLEDRRTQHELRCERSQVRERNGVWNATEGDTGSIKEPRRECLAGVGPSRAGRRLCRWLSAERVWQPATGGCRCRDGDARMCASTCDSLARHRDARCTGRCAHRGRTRAVRAVGHRNQYPKCPRHPGDALRAAPGTIERNRTQSGCVSHSPQCGGASS